MRMREPTEQQQKKATANAHGAKRGPRVDCPRALPEIILINGTRKKGLRDSIMEPGFWRQCSRADHEPGLIFDVYICRVLKNSLARKGQFGIAYQATAINSLDERA